MTHQGGVDDTGPDTPGAEIAAGWVPGLALWTACALVGIAIADSAARGSDTWAGPVFWIGLLAAFTPTALRLTNSSIGRTERVALITLLAVALYLVKVIYEPTQFVMHDELGHWRTTDDILRTGHLFHQNPVVGAYSYFPGLEIVTAALAKVSGVSIYVAGTVVVGIARLAGVLALFLLLERVAGSYIAGLAVAIYVCNPNSLYFDSQFAYESLALMLVFGVLTLTVLRPPGTAGAALTAVAIGVGLAVVPTHHIASYFMIAVLALWAITSASPAGSRTSDSNFSRSFVVPALGLSAGAALWVGLVARQHVAPELDPVGRSVTATVRLLQGKGSGGKELFHSASGETVESAWAQVVGFSSVILSLVLIPPGLWLFLRRRTEPRIALVLALLSLLYPITLALRFTAAGTETSNRASEYLFVGIGLAASTFLASWQKPAGIAARSFGRRGIRAKQVGSSGWRAVVVTVYLSVLFIGGIIVGLAPYARQPGPYLISADTRSIDPVNVRTAYWARTHLAAAQQVATDRNDGLTWAAYGRQNPQEGVIAGGVPVSTLFFSSTFTAQDRQIIAYDKITYIVVDLRQANGPPIAGAYFDGPVPNSYDTRNAIAGAALEKFAAVPELTKIYDAGAIVVYATGRLK